MSDASEYEDQVLFCGCGKIHPIADELNTAHAAGAAAERKRAAGLVAAVESIAVRACKCRKEQPLSCPSCVASAALAVYAKGTP